MYKDLIIHAFRNIKIRLLRSFLTILSILVGIMAIFALVSFGQGLSRYMSTTFEDLGADKLIIQPKAFGLAGGGNFHFTSDDVGFIRNVQGVDIATGIAFTYSQARPNDKVKPRDAPVLGTPVSGSEKDLVKSLLTVNVEQGRYLKKGDKFDIVVGHAYIEENKMFKKPLKLGDTLLINDQEMKIVGVLEPMGNPEDDKDILLEEKTMLDMFNLNDKYTYVYVKAKSGVDPNNLESYLTRQLRKHFNQKEGQEQFFVQTFAELMNTYGNVILVINSIVVIIALISVLVAAINITNTMYTSVLERTQEIGIMKAIGATNSMILKIFLIESASMGLIGGGIGVLFGFLIAKAGGAIAVAAGYGLLQPHFPIWLIIGSLVFATVVGGFSGIMPAIQASHQKPVDALRYE